jgi:predicted RNase H-like HicB family nuclease
VHVPYVVEQDEDGVWCASAQLRPGVGAVGDGATPEEAIADLRTGLEALLDVVVSVQDNWDEAWREAGEFLEAAKGRGLMTIRVTVRPVTISRGNRRARRAWGVFVIAPEPPDG